MPSLELAERHLWFAKTVWSSKWFICLELRQILALLKRGFCNWWSKSFLEETMVDHYFYAKLTSLHPVELSRLFVCGIEFEQTGIALNY